MNSDSTLILESPESSSPIITRSVSAALQGKYTETLLLPSWQRRALLVLGAFPQGVARYVISRFEALSGLSPSQIQGLSTQDLANERIQDYAQLTGKFPCITIGAALGGATAHLSVALGAPFLPQAFVITLRGGSPDGDVQTYFQRSAHLAETISRNNPELLTIQHYDPVHDEWMTRYVNHLRLKLLDLPPAYQQFIREHLEPGSAICYLDCQAQWLRYRTGERSVFQVGGWGDISAEEFLSSSERIQRYCRAVGLTKTDWRLPGFPLEKGAESEWGCESGLDLALEDFCSREGYRFVRISLPKPHDFSLLTYKTIEYLIHQTGGKPGGILIETFSQFDATAVVKASLLPVWLVFNTWDSLAFLKSMRENMPSEVPVFFSPLATFTQTPDIVPWDAWVQALEGLNWQNIGTRPSHYPADAWTLVNWAKPLRKWISLHPNPLNKTISAELLATLAHQIANHKPGVRL